MFEESLKGKFMNLSFTVHYLHLVSHFGTQVGRIGGIHPDTVIILGVRSFTERLHLNKVIKGFLVVRHCYRH